MLYRNLLAMDTEEMIRAQPLDGVVLLASCDKNIPAQLDGGRVGRQAGHPADRRADARFRESILPNLQRKTGRKQFLQLVNNQRQTGFR